VEEEIDVDTLRERYSALLAERNTFTSTIAALKKAYDKLLFEHEQLRRQTIGPKAEKVRHEEAQMSLLEVLAALGRLQAGDESAAHDAQAALDKAQAALDGNPAKPPRNRGGRRKLSLEDLPVQRVVLEPTERFAPGGEQLEKIGEEVTRLVDRTPASMVVLEVVRPKYKAPEASTSTSTDKIVIAEMPERAIPRAMAEPGLLAHILVSKFADHIPLHRQEAIFKREGFRIARSTLGEWVQASTTLLGHVFEAMWQDAKDNATYSIVDATGVLVQARDECKRAHFYVVVVPREHVLFRFTRENDGPTVAALLADFKGFIHADAATVYHQLYRQELDHLVEVGCWAHARRKFFDAISRDRERSLMGIGFISHLYDAHRAALGPDGIADTEKRATLARPLLEKIFEWAEREMKIVEESTPIHAALGYLVRQREPLQQFLIDGRLRLDTNPAELELRKEVVGRKNWLFVGSDDGARWNTITVSLVASCQMHDIEPWGYLRDVLTLLPSWPQQRVLELAPKNWRATLARPDTQERLAELRLIDRARPVDPMAPIADAHPA
jgi:transposase